MRVNFLALPISFALALGACGDGEPQRGAARREAAEQAAVQRLVESTGAKDDVRHRFGESRTVWSYDLQNLLIDGSPHVFLGTIADIHQGEKGPQIIVTTRLGGVLGEEFRLVLDADESQVKIARSGASGGDILASILPPYAVAATVDRVDAKPVSDEEGGSVMRKAGHGTLVSLMPVEATLAE